MGRRRECSVSKRVTKKAQSWYLWALLRTHRNWNWNNRIGFSNMRFLISLLAGRRPSSRPLGAGACAVFVLAGAQAGLAVTPSKSLFAEPERAPLVNTKTQHVAPPPDLYHL